MQRKAICPNCGYHVPRWWFVSRKLRPCVRCGAWIKAIDRNDKWWSIFLGAVVPPASGLIVAIIAAAVWPVGSRIDVAGVGLGIGTVLGAPLTVAISFWAFPYFAPFEQRQGFPVLPAKPHNTGEKKVELNDELQS